MSLSSDPEKREAQVANLMVGAESPGTVRPGDRLRLTHGLRSRSSFGQLAERVPEVAVLLEEIVEAIPVRDADGRVVAGDMRQAEVLAVMGHQVAMAGTYFASHPDERLASMALWNTLAERYSRGLERLGIGASARVRLGLDMAQGQSLAQRMAAVEQSKSKSEGDGQ
jgi:hypothetical protein